MKYKNYLYKKPKTSKLAWHDVIIISVDEIKIYATGNTKSIFTVQELNGDTKRQCVYWSDKKLNVGDVLQIQGWKKEDVFVITSLLRRERAK